MGPFDIGGWLRRHLGSKPDGLSGRADRTAAGGVFYPDRDDAVDDF